MNLLWNEEDKEKNIKGSKQKEVLGSLLFQQKWWQLGIFVVARELHKNNESLKAFYIDRKTWGSF